MENFINYQCSGQTWDNLYTVPYQNGSEVVPVAKQRCQANARERDRTQKLVPMIYRAFVLKIFIMVDDNNSLG